MAVGFSPKYPEVKTRIITIFDGYPDSIFQTYNVRINDPVNTPAIIRSDSVQQNTGSCTLKVLEASGFNTPVKLYKQLSSGSYSFRNLRYAQAYLAGSRSDICKVVYKTGSYEKDQMCRVLVFPANVVNLISKWDIAFLSVDMYRMINGKPVDLFLGPRKSLNNLLSE